MSRNTLDALERTNQGHQLLAMKAIGLIADSSMSFHSAEGRDAYYLNVRGDLAIHAHLNDQARYDVISISASTGEPIFLSVPPPATPHSQAPSIMSAQASSNSRLAQHPRSNLLQASIEQHNPQDFTGASQPSGASSVLKGANSKRVQDPDNPEKTITLGALRSRQRLLDPENAGQTVTRGALAARKYYRQQMEAPGNPEQIILRGVLSQQRQVEDPENSGKTVSRGTLAARKYARQQVEDPDHPGRIVSQGTLAARKHARQRVEDPEHPGRIVSQGTLASRKHGRQQVEDPEHPGELISRSTLKRRRLLARVAAAEAEAEDA